MNETKSEILRTRVSPEEKERVEVKAKKADMTTSQFVRTCCLSDNKIIILEEGKVIAQKLCETYALLERCTDEHCFDERNSRRLCDLMERILRNVTELCSHLTDITDDIEEEEE